MSEWISVMDKMPEPYRDVLVAVDIGDEVAIEVSNWWPESIQGAVGEIIVTHWLQDLDPSHWMPLPEPPKLEEPKGEE